MFSRWLVFHVICHPLHGLSLLSLFDPFQICCFCSTEDVLFKVLFELFLARSQDPSSVLIFHFRLLKVIINHFLPWLFRHPYHIVFCPIVSFSFGLWSFSFAFTWPVLHGFSLHLLLYYVQTI